MFTRTLLLALVDVAGSAAAREFDSLSNSNGLDEMSAVSFAAGIHAMETTLTEALTRDRDGLRKAAVTLMRAGLAVKTMAQLQVGQSVIDDALFKNVGSAVAMDRKVKARRVMGEPAANWKARSTTRGVRVTRTA